MRSTYILRLCGAVFLGLLLTPLVPISKTSGAETNQNLLALINQQRSGADVNKLSYNNKLSASAFAKAQNMCKENYWAHTAPSGLTPWSFIDNSGYQYISAAENLAEGYSSDANTITAWMDSPGHRKNILNGKFADFGAGYISCELEGKNTTIIVTHFGTPRTPSVATAQKQPQKVAPAPSNTIPQTASKKPQSYGEKIILPADAEPKTANKKVQMQTVHIKPVSKNMLELLAECLFNNNSYLFTIS